MNRFRNYQFTINNYTKKNLKELKKLSESLKKHNYICYGLEIAPETKTPHIQGYVQLLEPMTYTQLQKYFNLKKRNKLVKFHCENALKDAETNIKYTSKTRKQDKEPNAEWYQYGEPKKQGARNDLIEIKELVKKSPSNIKELVDNNISNNQQLRFAQNLQQYYFEKRDINNPPVVIWLFGKSGIGKTSLVYDSFDSVCAVSNYEWLGTDYNQQECLLFDDFRKSDIKFHNLLKICDRFPYTLFYKGGQIPLNSPFIVITTPKSICDTYGEHDEDLTQLKRRVFEFDLNNYSIKDLKKIKKNYVKKNKQSPKTLEDEF